MNFFILETLLYFNFEILAVLIQLLHTGQVLMPYYSLTLTNAKEIHTVSQQLVFGADLLLSAAAPSFKLLADVALGISAGSHITGSLGQAWANAA